MAKKNRPDEDPQQEEMAVVIFRLKGGGDTLQKGFDTISQALSAFAPQPRVIQTRRGHPPELHAANGDVDQPEINDFEEQEEAPSAPHPAKPAGPRKEKWKFLSDFNMEGDGTPFKEFASKKGELGEDEKYMVSAYWLQKHGGCENFSGNHIFSCFRTMAWKTRDDMTAPMRRLKQTKSYFDRLARGQWKLNPLGMKAAEAIGSGK